MFFLLRLCEVTVAESLRTFYQLYGIVGNIVVGGYIKVEVDTQERPCKDEVNHVHDYVIER